MLIVFAITAAALALFAFVMAQRAMGLVCLLFATGALVAALGNAWMPAAALGFVAWCWRPRLT